MLESRYTRAINGIDIDRVLSSIFQITKNVSNPEIFEPVKTILAVIYQIAVEGDTNTAKALLSLLKERLFLSKVFEGHFSELRAEIEKVEKLIN